MDEMKNNKYKIIIGSVLVMAIGVTVLANIPKDNAVPNIQEPVTLTAQKVEGSLLTINEIAIPQEEYIMFLQDQKALTVNYFTQTHGAEYDVDFWESRYGEEVPINLAKEAALEELVRIKIEQQVAKELGLIKDANFNALIDEMEKEESIYGAENMDLFQKYSVFHSKLVLDAKEKFKLNHKKIEEKILKTKYEEVKETMFNAPDDLKVIDLAIEVLDGNDHEVVLNEILEAINQGITIDDLIDTYQGKGIIMPGEKNYGAYEGKDANLSEEDLMLKEVAYTLEAGEMTLPIPSGERYHILVCLERQAKGVADFEEVEIVVEDMLKEEAYENYIDELVAKVKVEINEKEYDAIIMQ